MKITQLLVSLVLVTTLSVPVFSQHIKLIEGDLSPLKNEKTIVTEFTYENMRVGKFDKEDDYIVKKKEDYNKKEAGRGDNWAKSWTDDRRSRFEPKFNELFEKHSEMSVGKTGKYTVIFKTTFTEPGFNVGVMKKNAEIDADVWIVETANKDKVIAKLTVHNAPGRSFFGNDYDTGERIAESYASAGKALGKFIKKQ